MLPPFYQGGSESEPPLDVATFSRHTSTAHTCIAQNHQIILATTRHGLIPSARGSHVDSSRKIDFKERPPESPTLQAKDKGVTYLAPLASAMAASSGDDVPTQLAALLGREIFRIRKTDETPPRVSIIDVVMAVTGGSQHDAARSLRRLSDQYPEVGPNWSHLKFKGRGQRDTCVTEAKGIVEVIMLLPGQQAARVRRQAAELLCRYLGGDIPDQGIGSYHKLW